VSDARGALWYFAVTDRFAEANPDNPHGKQLDFDPSRTRFSNWWGGDLAGVIGELDRLAALGVRVLWLTPPFAQHPSELQGDERKTNYHGYRPRDLTRLDAHLGDADADEIPSAAGVVGRLLTEAHQRNIRLLLDLDGLEHAAPTEGPRGSDVPAWCEAVSRQVAEWVALGFDGVRLGNLRDEPLAFWSSLIAGVRAVRPDALVVGEGPPDDDIDGFARDERIYLLDLSWRHAVTSAFAHRYPDALRALASSAEEPARTAEPGLRVTMVDHLDFPRFLSLCDDPARFRLATLLTLVARGTPCLFYGNEVSLHDDHHRGNDPYNRPWLGRSPAPTPLAGEISQLAALRAAHPALRFGGMRTKFVDDDRYAFTRCWGGDRVLVAVNRQDSPTGFGVIGVELSDGRYVDVLGGADLELDDGAARVTLPGRGIAIYVESGPISNAPTVDVTVRGVQSQFGQQVELVTVSDDGERAFALEYLDRGTWGGSVAIPGVGSPGPARYRYRLVAANGVVADEAGVRERAVNPNLPWYDQWEPSSR
jgi:glycosidase